MNWTTSKHWLSLAHWRVRFPSTSWVLCASSVAVVLGATFPSAAGALAGASSSGFFRTPSGNIECEHAYGLALDGVTKIFHVRCAIKSGIKPLPPRKAGCSRYHSVAMRPTGRSAWADAECPGLDAPDAPFGDPSAILAYGRTWKGNGMSCTSAVAGLTCRNRSGHGFFLSRAHTYLF